MEIKYTQSALADVDKAIEAAHDSYHTTKKKIQVACVSVLMHAEQHGDYSKAQVLIDGLKGLNQAALVEYFKRFGGLTVSEDETGFSGWSGADHIRQNFTDAKATMWWDLKVQQPYKGFSNLQKLHALRAETEKARKVAQKDAEKAEKIQINDALDSEIQALLEKYAA